eukprot:316893_1
MADTMWIAFIVSSSSLILLWFLSIQQICITLTTDTQRIRRTVSIAMFTFYGIIYNALGYISSMHPNYKLFGVLDIILFNHIMSDVLIAIIGTHIYRRLTINIINSLYKPINMKRPRWIKITFVCMELFIDIMVILCYIFAYIVEYPNMPWIDLFWMVFSVLIGIIQTAITVYLLLKLLNILNGLKNIQSNDQNNSKLKYGTRMIKLSIFIFLGVIIVSCFSLFIIAKRVWFNQSSDIHASNTLEVNIIHSVYIFTVICALLLGICKYKCCRVRTGGWSVCALCYFWCCADCVQIFCGCCWWCDKDEQTVYIYVNSEQRQAMQLKDSTKSTNTRPTVTTFPAKQ